MQFAFLLVQTMYFPTPFLFHFLNLVIKQSLVILLVSFCYSHGFQYELF